MADVTPTELSILESLWDQAPATIRELADRLYPGGSPAHYATVQKLLDRLLEKGFVSREKDGRAFAFSPTMARDDLIDRRLDAVAADLCDGAVGPLITRLARRRDLSSDELGELRDLIRKLDDDRGREARR